MIRNLEARIDKLEQCHSLKDEHPPQGELERLIWAIRQLSRSSATSSAKEIRPEDSPFLILLEASKSGLIDRLMEQLGIEIGEDD